MNNVKSRFSQLVVSINYQDFEATSDGLRRVISLVQAARKNELLYLRAYFRRQRSMFGNRGCGYFKTTNPNIALLGKKAIEKICFSYPWSRERVVLTFGEVFGATPDAAFSDVRKIVYRDGAGEYEITEPIASQIRARYCGLVKHSLHIDQDSFTNFSVVFCDPDEKYIYRWPSLMEVRSASDIKPIDRMNFGKTLDESYVPPAWLINADRKLSE
jgi:hypothetical protein